MTHCLMLIADLGSPEGFSQVWYSPQGRQATERHHQRDRQQDQVH